MLGTMINVITAPGETFETIVKDFNWKHALLPLIILMLLNYVSGTIMYDDIIDHKFEQIKNVIENSSRIPQEQKENFFIDMEKQRVNNKSIIVKIFLPDSITLLGASPGWLTTDSAFQWPIRILFWSLFVMFVGNLFLGGGGSFGRIFTISAFAYLPSVIEYVIKVPIQYFTENLFIFTSLGVLDIGEQGEFLNSFLAGIDMFAFWRVFLVALGVSLLYNKSTKTTLITMTGLWLFGLAVFAGMMAVVSGIFV